MTKIEILNKLNQINKLRRIEHSIGFSEFQRGQLSGAQQALAWLGLGSMEPVRGILTDNQIWKGENAMTTTCKIVDAQWTDANELDLNWLEEHIKTCSKCQEIMGQSADMFDEEPDDEEETE